MRFNDKVAIETGAASGIGRATAQRLYCERAALTLIDRNADALADSRAAWIRHVWHCGVDVGNERYFDDCVDEIHRRSARSTCYATTQPGAIGTSAIETDAWETDDRLCSTVR